LVLGDSRISASSHASRRPACLSVPSEVQYAGSLFRSTYLDLEISLRRIFLPHRNSSTSLDYISRCNQSSVHISILTPNASDCYVPQYCNVPIHIRSPKYDPRWNKTSDDLYSTDPKQHFTEFAPYIKCPLPSSPPHLPSLHNINITPVTMAEISI
jgi:hypothetical protein